MKPRIWHLQAAVAGVAAVLFAWRITAEYGPLPLLGFTVGFMVFASGEWGYA